MLITELFKSGRLLLPDSPPEAAAQAVTDSTAFLAPALLVAFLLIAMFLVPTFFHLLPFLADSLFRARGSTALEGSVRVSRDRNLVALSLLIPALLLVYRYRLYDPSFIRGLASGWRMLAVAGVFFAYMLVRLVVYLWLKPRRHYDHYQMAHRAGFTFFILLMLLVLPTVGVLVLVGCNDLTIRLFIYAETAFVYLVFLFRRMQILYLSCNFLRTFSYLCALEFIPTSLLILSAVVL